MTASRWFAVLLAEATTPPRWPMYPRQFKQFLRTAQPDFDERRYGSIADLMRACQKDGMLRLERDRQGALRVFASGGSPRASVPHGWGLGVTTRPEAAAGRRSAGSSTRSPRSFAAPKSSMPQITASRSSRRSAGAESQARSAREEDALAQDGKALARLPRVPRRKN